MTTMVYDHKKKQVAIDSRTTADSVILSDNSDKTINNDNGLYLLCGSPGDYTLFVTLSHDDEVKVIPDVSAILIKDGKAYQVMMSDKFCIHTELKYNCAQGSGYKFALAALDFGKTAKEAVEYAITKDCYTGGKVRVFNLDGKEVK